MKDIVYRIKKLGERIERLHSDGEYLWICVKKIDGDRTPYLLVSQDALIGFVKSERELEFEEMRRNE